MTTIDTVLNIPGEHRASRAWRVVRARGRHAVRQLAIVRDRARRPVLTTSGFACFSAAGFQVSSILGFVVTGAALLTLEWLGGHE